MLIVRIIAGDRVRDVALEDPRESFCSLYNRLMAELGLPERAAPADDA